MISLIWNELYKIFHKKSIYILGIIILVFILLNNILDIYLFDKDGNMKNIVNIDSLAIDISRQELDELDPNKESDKTLYTERKTTVDMLELASKYDSNSWQYYIINEEMEGIIYNINYYTYVSFDSENLKINKASYDKYLTYFEEDDYEGFLTDKINNIDNDITVLENERTEETDKKKLEEITTSLDNLIFEKELLNYRKEKNIKYGNNYLNTALTGYQDAYRYLKNSKNFDTLSYEEKRVYNENIESYHLNKYIIDNEVNVNKPNTLKNNFVNSITNSEILIVILIIIIAGTTISNEFNKGTIKSLLVRPYSRTKILLSKYITAIILLLMVIIFTLLCDFLIGGIFYSFDSLKEGVVIYNFNKNSIQVYNTFIYTLIMIGSNLPMFIIILTLAFAISTITLNSQLGIALPLVIYMFGDGINSLATSFNLKWMKFLPTLNWRLDEYLFGNLPLYRYSNLTNAIIVCLIYTIIFVIISIIVFRKRNVKNI